jgi:hypothetical protein
MDKFIKKETTEGLSQSSTREPIKQIEPPIVTKTMNGKPVIMRPNARTVLNRKSQKFEEKLLCDGITLNPGDACVFSCGFSTGTLDDDVAKAIEAGTARVSKRIESLHWLQDEGYRTFAMICPSLPPVDGDYQRFSREICEAIRVDRCEHGWAEVINLRGRSLVRTLGTLHIAGFEDEALALSAVMGAGNKRAWEHYSRATFLAHTKNVPAGKLRFLQYVDESTVDWWARRRKGGAVLLGKTAEKMQLTTSAR